MWRGLAAIISALIWAAPPAEASHAHSDPYRGLGAWIDRYDPDAWRRPERTIRSLAMKRVNTIFLQTGNYALADALPPRRALGKFVDIAHREHLQIVAWYAPDLCHLRRDKRRSLAAIRFRSARGQRFDSFGLDIESACVRSPRRRNQRLLRLSRSLRGAVGRNYPLAAIVPSPRGMQLRAEAYWPRFPFAALHRHYDAFVLMTYFTYRATGTESVRAFTAKDIALLRAVVRDRDVAIHSIGGEAQRATVADVRGFTAAVREANVHGVSLYDATGTTPQMWASLHRVLPLPAPREPSASTSGPPAVSERVLDVICAVTEPWIRRLRCDRHTRAASSTTARTRTFASPPQWPCRGLQDHPWFPIAPAVPVATAR